MCKRYALKCIDLTNQTMLVVDADIWFPSHFNIAPSSKNPVIIAAPNGNHLKMMEWGLVPHWATDIRTMPRPANARAERLMERPMFRDLLKDHRCLVPASGFYEWKREGARKVPFYFCRKDRALLLFAGMFDNWQDLTGEMRETYTIITTVPNNVIAPIHDRMPVILTEEGVQRWLSNNPLSPGDLQEILIPCDPDLIEVYPVSSMVNKISNDDENLITPVQSPLIEF